MSKIILIFAFFYNIIYSCTGDCLACHENLKNSLELDHHKILKTCISCHSDNIGKMSSCGEDCFACHDKQKLIYSKRVEHQAIAKCSKCHNKKESILQDSIEKNPQTIQQLLNLN